jgi:hypothetical protein
MDNPTIEAFFEDVARRFVPVSHTDANPRFCRFDMEELVSGFRQKMDTTGFCLLLETPTGRLIDNDGDGYFDQQELAFWLVRGVELNNFTKERETLHLAREYGKQILVECRNKLTAQFPLDLKTVEYDKVKLPFDNVMGYRYSFTQDDVLVVVPAAGNWSHG